MSLLSIIIALVVTGLVLWTVNKFIPMDEKIKNILNIVVVIVLVVWLLNSFGVFGYLSGIHL